MHASRDLSEDMSITYDFANLERSLNKNRIKKRNRMDILLYSLTKIYSYYARNVDNDLRSCC